LSRTSKLYAALAVCVFLFVALGLALLRPGLPDYAPYLSFSPDTDGVKAVRLLLEERGASVVEWRLPPDRLSNGRGETYVAVEPAGMTTASVERLLRWAERGNEVIVFGRTGVRFLDGWKAIYAETPEAEEIAVVVREDGRETIASAITESGLRLAHDPNAGERGDAAGGGDEASSDDGAPNGEATSNRGATSNGEAASNGEATSNGEAVSDGEALLRDEAGALAVRQAVGQGFVTVAVSPEWLRNDTVPERSHLELVWRILGGSDAIASRTIYFDEYHHGYAASPGIAQVYPAWLLAAAAQLALAAVAWLWWKGKRFGAAYAPRSFVVRRGDETLLAVAGWYRYGRLADRSLAHAVGRLRAVLQTRVGVPPHAGAEQLAAAAERALRDRPADPSRMAALRDALRRWETAARDEAGTGKPAYGETEWLADCIAIGETIRTLEEDK